MYTTQMHAQAITVKASVLVHGFMGKKLSYGLQVRDGDQVMVCLKRALKIAHAAQQQLAVAMRQSDSLPAALFVEILNHYLYYFDQGLTLISSTVLQVNIPFYMLATYTH